MVAFIGRQNGVIKPESDWFYTSHLSTKETHHLIKLFGFKSTPRTDKARSQPHLWHGISPPHPFSGKERCLDCALKGHNCFIPYIDALRLGYVEEEVGKEELRRSIDALELYYAVDGEGQQRARKWKVDILNICGLLKLGIDVDS